jgi:hypothetical protein
MPLIDLRLSLDLDPQQPQPEVRAFIDLQPNLGLSSEMELPLRKRGKRDWVGSFALGEGQACYFLYRVALAAHAGASWELVFRERKSGVELLADSDTFEIAKCWLVGSCEGPRRPQRTASPQTAFDSARGATACRLLRPAAGFSPARHLALQRLEPAQHGEPQHDGARDASQQQRLFVLGELSDQRVGAIDERLRKPERDNRGV